MKDSNEITVKIIGKMDEFIDNLKSKDYKMEKHFILDDTYITPSDLDIEKLSTRDIISKSILLRKNLENGSKSNLTKLKCKWNLMNLIKK